jgi:hypothetical protein
VSITVCLFQSLVDDILSTSPSSPVVTIRVLVIASGSEAIQRLAQESGLLRRYAPHNDAAEFHSPTWRTENR